MPQAFDVARVLAEQEGRQVLLDDRALRLAAGEGFTEANYPFVSVNPNPEPRNASGVRSCTTV